MKILIGLAFGVSAITTLAVSLSKGDPNAGNAAVLFSVAGAFAVAWFDEYV